MAARRSRHLREAVLKGSRRSDANSPLEPVLPATALRDLYMRDSLWHTVLPRSSSKSFVPDRCTVSDGANSKLENVLRYLEEEFLEKGLSYRAEAACSARLKLSNFDFHPALWPHIRRVENENAVSFDHS